MTSQKVYITGMARGSEFNGRKIEECPICGKNAFLVGERGDLQVWGHVLQYHRGVADPRVWGCETRIRRPGLIVPPQGMTIPQDTRRISSRYGRG